MATDVDFDDDDKLEDEIHLERIKEGVISLLIEKGVPTTTRNVIHAMFDLHHADWLGGVDLFPTCDYEHFQGNGF